MNLTIIIPAAGPCRKMKTIGPKSLIHIEKDGRSIIRRQLDILKELWPKADFIVVVGYESEKLIRTLPKWVKVVENENYENTGVLRSIGLGLRASNTENCLIVYGDLAFTKKSIQDIVGKKSSILIQKNCCTFSEEPGVIINNSKIAHVDYGLDDKWSKIFFLNGKQLESFKLLSNKLDKRTHLSHEIINKIIDDGGEFIPIYNKDKNVVCLNTIQDLKKIESII